MPSILFVDDNPDDVTRFVESLAGRIEAKAVHPQDVTINDLASASLVLVDSRLDNWPERDALGQVALKPINGKALAAVLRAHAENAGGAGLTAFALLTAHLEDYSQAMQAENREHSLARSNNLEWVFRKATDLQTLTTQFSILAGAVTRLPQIWPLSDPEETERLLSQLLGIKEEREWASRAFLDVQKCHPPARELSEWSHGIELLRWLLHRILPYPCFLWDPIRVAARLRMTVTSFENLLGTESDLAKALAECEYTGLANQFLGRRWWRAGLESMLWAIADGQPFDVGTLRKALAARSTSQIESSKIADPIVCIDENYRALEEFGDISSSVRLMLDDWPSYADPPWTTVSIAKQHPELLAAVLEQDKEKVQGARANDG
jgi:hypothetical protein